MPGQEFVPRTTASGHQINVVQDDGHQLLSYFIHRAFERSVLGRTPTYSEGEFILEDSAEGNHVNHGFNSAS